MNWMWFKTLTRTGPVNEEIVNKEMIFGVWHWRCLEAKGNPDGRAALLWGQILSPIQRHAIGGLLTPKEAPLEILGVEIAWVKQ